MEPAFYHQGRPARELPFSQGVFSRQPLHHHVVIHHEAGTDVEHSFLDDGDTQSVPFPRRAVLRSRSSLGPRVLGDNWHLHAFDRNCNRLYPLKGWS